MPGSRTKLIAAICRAPELHSLPPKTQAWHVGPGCLNLVHYMRTPVVFRKMRLIRAAHRQGFCQALRATATR